MNHYYTHSHNAVNPRLITHRVTVDLVGQQDYSVLPETVTLVRLSRLDHELLVFPNTPQFTCLREFVELSHYRHTIARITRKVEKS